ncbi:hypothetical protein [Devosia sp. 919]|uniref:hypothetical protein n=1 Tax=Devosia sp. 919 TaxID=2726065 RepID=UPI001AED2E0C|nr:hypothetical protein [Devosia sp. 919]
MPRMNVKDAVSAAKAFVSEVLAEENPTNVGLEEVDYDDRHNKWNVTIGFSRPWNTSRSAVAAITGEQLQKRAYRVITIDDASGNAISMKRRDVIETD